MNAPCKLYLTYRSEYLVLRDLCVGVRDRATGTWIPLHAASCAHVLGPLNSPSTPTPSAHGELLPITRVRIGERLALYATSRRIVTGPIVAVEVASDALLSEADRQWQAVFGGPSRRDSIITLAGTG